mmetsp:Transcript_7452/g.16422  ORF Transcript_7452/g.16422 Transcript_7452/m.16422 type:complete len:207 (+) Transcript_7452:212-832(+)
MSQPSAGRTRGSFSSPSVMPRSFIACSRSWMQFVRFILRAFWSAVPSGSPGESLALASSSASTTSPCPKYAATMSGVLPSLRRASTFAPDAISKRTARASPASHAAYKGVRRSADGWSTFTPAWLSSSLHISVCPFCAAIQRGQRPPDVTASMAAPARSKIRAHSMWPFLLAMKSGVAPSGVRVSRMSLPSAAARRSSASVPLTNR